MALQQLAALGRVARSGGRLAQAIAGRPFSWREAQRAADAVGPGAAMPVVVIMAAIGSIAAIEGSSVLRHFGAPALLPAMLAQAIVRDFAPTMTALMLAAQVGTSFAGELGAMRVGDEIDALSVIGVDPLAFLVVPRIVALIVLAPLLTVLGAAAAVLGAFVMAAVGYGTSAASFFTTLLGQISLGSLGEAGLKAIAFGTMVGILACRHGLCTVGGPEGVGRAANRTVVQSILAIAALNALITCLLLGRK